VPLIVFTNDPTPVAGRFFESAAKPHFHIQCAGLSFFPRPR
jgi:hypothetical protein